MLPRLQRVSAQRTSATTPIFGITIWRSTVKLTDTHRICFIMLLSASLLALMAWWQYSLWDECRSTNSFFYCLRVLSK